MTEMLTISTAQPEARPSLIKPAVRRAHGKRLRVPAKQTHGFDHTIVFEMTNSRRTFLAAAAAAPLARTQVQRTAGTRLKIGLNAYSFNTPLMSGKMTLFDVIDYCAANHIDGADLTGYYFPGYPNVAVPVGQVFGLPLGISFFGRAFSEPMLIKLAFAFEQATQARKAPKFLTTVG